MEDLEMTDQSEEAKIVDEESKETKNDKMNIKVRHQIYMQQGPFLEFAVKTNNQD